MSYEVKQAPIGARFGAGLAQGLSQVLPQEMERGRLRAGLKKIAEQSQNPLMKQYAQFASVPGITPQMLQTFGELAKSQSMAGAGERRFGGEEEQTKIPGIEEGKIPKGNISQKPSEKQESKPDLKPYLYGDEYMEKGKKIPSITTKEALRQQLNPYIPWGEEKIREVGQNLFKKHPDYYKYDINNAIDEARNINQSNLQISEALEKRRAKEQQVLTNVKNTLEGYKSQFEDPKKPIPSDVYNQVQDKAVEAVESGKMTEEQAGRHFGKELLEIDRQYADVRGLGGWPWIWGKAKSTETAMENIQKDFAKRNDLRNLADTFISAGFSPELSYSKSYPLSDNKKMMDILNPMYKFDVVVGGNPFKEIEAQKKYEKNIPKIFESMTKEDSPLAVGHYLRKKGYDPQSFYDYVSENKDRLTQLQSDQLRKVQPFLNINDFWID